MKLFIASDIHGSAVWCRRLVQCFSESGAELLVLLGDILYHGPRNDLPQEYAPKTVISLLNPLAHQIVAVRGNCESEVDGMVLSFSVSADYGVLCDGKRIIYISHGHREVPKMGEGTVYLTGHTHVPLAQREENCIHLNPGSVSIPKENSPHSYMLYEDGVFTWHDLADGREYKRYETETENT